MCGICGVLSSGSDASLAGTARAMADTLRHRGPDDAGVWADPNKDVAIGHRRLSIVDLSPAGAQPMTSGCGRYVIAFNGEIYNHIALRADLGENQTTIPWRGSSDTETLLEAIAHWGIQETLHRAYGMFALALWDRQAQQLHLARDRMGEKPLYLAKSCSGWVFASELKALHHAPEFNACLDREAVATFLAYGYVPDNQCIFQDVLKVPPGGILTLVANSETPDLSKYHDLTDDIASAEGGGPRPKPTDFESATRHMEDVLREVVDEQMLSDVPLGCFLSGGIDSSLVAAMMQVQRDSPVLTFSIGFKEARFNEAPHAAAVARHLRTNHTEFILGEDDALGVITDLPQIYDEPFADSSQIPTTLLCREAGKAVTVALTGDGGDEIFGGYNRHVMGPRLLRRLQQVPRPLRRQGSRLAAAFGPSLMHEDSWARRTAVKLKLPVTALDKLIALAPTLAETRDIADLYRSFTRSISDPSTLLRDRKKVPDGSFFFDLQDAEWMMAMDSVTYLPGDILVKVDRAAMANSLETRAPFLDARVVKEAWRLPLNMKIASGTGKRILREILYQHVPKELIDRPKQGFAIPLDRWLRGALRSWGEDLLADPTLFRIAGLDHAVVLDLWNRHQSRAADLGAKLWNVLTLLDWVRAYQDNILPTDAALSSAKG